MRRCTKGIYSNTTAVQVEDTVPKVRAKDSPPEVQSKDTLPEVQTEEAHQNTAEPVNNGENGFTCVDIPDGILDRIRRRSLFMAKPLETAHDRKKRSRTQHTNSDKQRKTRISRPNSVHASPARALPAPSTSSTLVDEDDHGYDAQKRSVMSPTYKMFTWHLAEFLPTPVSPLETRRSISSLVANVAQLSTDNSLGTSGTGSVSALRSSSMAPGSPRVPHRYDVVSDLQLSLSRTNLR